MLSTDDVKHIATLARVGLTDAEVTHFQKDLSAVIDWFGELKDVDVSGAPAETSMAPESNRAAKDVDVLSGEAPQILANAPGKKENYFKVKSVF
ncbi:MAG: Asp-tRNA(Asn)/Glu-tRNA(Gln) amidotransferase subunit GatC [Undibacterium sp.]